MAGLPRELEDVLSAYYTCEFTTLNRRGEPLTWPTEPLYEPHTGKIVVTASIAFPVKALNARRNSHVSLLFSDPTGCGLDDPPAVLVQGDAEVEESLEWTPRSEALFRQSVLRQPDSAQFISNPIARKLFTFYFQRLMILVEPRRVLVWLHRDFSVPPSEVPVSHVE